MASVGAWNALLVPTSESWHLVNRSRSGGLTLTGAEQAVATGTPFWRNKRTVPVFRDTQVVPARRLITALEGRANTVTVGPCGESRRGPSPLGTYTLTSGAALGATSVVITTAGGGASPLSGQMFSLEGWLYVITFMAGSTATIRPKLRVASLIGAALNFSTPTTTMRLANDDTGEMELEMQRFGTVTFDMLEVPP